MEHFDAGDCFEDPDGVVIRIIGHRGETINFALPLSPADLVLRFLPTGMRVTANGQEVDVARMLTEVRNGSGA